MKKKLNIAKVKFGGDVSFIELFRFCSWNELLLLLPGISLAAISGILQPFTYWLYGIATGDFIKFVVFLNDKGTDNEAALADARNTLMEGVRFFTLWTCVSGVLTFLSCYLSIYLIRHAAVRQISKMRSAYMESMLNKDISWYDINQTGDFSSRIVEELGKIEEALGDKLASFVHYIALCLCGIILALAKGWQLAIICLVFLVISIIQMVFVSWLNKKMAQEELNACGSAGAIAEEVLGSIRTVVAFEGQQKELDRYRKFLTIAIQNAIKRGLFNAMNNAFMWFLVYSFYGLSFWYGVKLIVDERHVSEEERVYTPANMLIVFFCVLMATFNLSQCAPFIQIFSQATAAAANIFQIIDEPPTINLSKNKGVNGPNLEGNISFRDVHFHYPSRQDVPILNNFSLEIHRGQTVALVGSSGCGKSTCLQLIQRLYDPVSGGIFVDNLNLKEYDLNWLRNNIGIVGQEPILFATTIEENISFGNPKASLEDIMAAAIKSNAHNFICKLPNGYKTIIGERGTQLSGGQKQRIAIARALVRNPSILLLDEATSALDMHSEALVQNALDNASENCTTVIVAHRLSTIRGANRIVVVNNGGVIEDGDHETLLELKGDYYNLVMAELSDAEGQNKGKTLPASAKIGEQLVKKESVLPTNKDLLRHEKLEDVSGSCSAIWKILKLNSTEWWVIILGLIGAFVNGASIPLYAMVYGGVIAVMADPDDDYVRAEGNKYSLYFVIVGVISAVSSFMQAFMFSISGEKLTRRIKYRMFETLLKQEIGWYDESENGVGAICTKLSNETSMIQGASGQPIGTILNSVSSLGVAIIIAFCYEWRIALVSMCFIPLIFISVYLEAVISNSSTAGNQNALQNSSKFAVEAIGNIRTVVSLCIERVFHTKYMEFLAPHYAHSKRNAHMRGVVFGLSKSLFLFGDAAVTYYGATLIRDEFMEYSWLYIISRSMLLGAWAMANAVAFTPNISKGIESSKKMFQLLNRTPAIRDNETSVISNISRNTDLYYKNIRFRYPTRPNASVLEGLDMNIIHGKTVALVGPSGCGKSTIIQLLERFYDPLEGELCVNEGNIKNVNLSALRMHLGIVSQEPSLFDKTIMENIAYGDNSRLVTKEECIDAAKKANIHSFISSLPLGYDTRLGQKGTQLSGGQKQRVAIARALVRNPQILLLDEATSALDNESEKIVQEALDAARKGRTCITIAHRLKTIQDADLICVIDKGKVAEMGTHQKLMEQEGIYYNLNLLQIGRK